MPRDLIAEQALLQLSQAQREALERWFRLCVDASQFDAAEDIRKAIEAKDRKREAGRAAA